MNCVSLAAMSVESTAAHLALCMIGARTKRARNKEQRYLAFMTASLGYGGLTGWESED